MLNSPELLLFPKGVDDYVFCGALVYKFIPQNGFVPPLLSHTFVLSTQNKQDLKLGKA